MPRGRRIVLTGVLAALLVGSFTSSAGADPDDGFRVTGQPIRTVEADDPEDAASLAEPVRAGRYQVDLAAEDTSQWVALDKAPGTTLWVTLVSQIPYDDLDEELEVWVGTPDGEECASESADMSSYDEYRGPVPLGVSIDPATVDSDVEADCFNADRLLLGIDRDDDEGDALAAELIVLEEPKVSGGFRLPESAGSDDDFDPTWRGTATSLAADGARSFSDAPAIENGRYRDRIGPGGVRLYRVDAKFGQRVRAVVNLPALPPGDAARLSDDLDIAVAVAGPTRDVIASDTETTSDESNVTIGTTTPPLRYRNRESDDSEIERASLAGPQYVMVSLRDDEASIELPYELDVRVTGKPGGAPGYTGAGAPDEPRSADGAERTDNADSAGNASGTAAGTSLEWPVAGPVLAGLAAALLVCLIGLALRRRTRGR